MNVSRRWHGIGQVSRKPEYLHTRQISATKPAPGTCRPARARPKNAPPLCNIIVERGHRYLAEWCPARSSA
eukprot:5880860-Pyramimonas_sp.AAC.2